MSYYNEIDKKIKNGLENYTSIEELKKLPLKTELENLDFNKLYKVNFVTIAVDVIEYKKLNEFSDSESLSAIMNQFISGTIKILKNFMTPSRIEIQGDGIYAIYSIADRDGVDTAFTILCGLNTFQRHLNKHIEKLLNGKIKNSLYTVSKFNFGIGASFSFDNLISKMGHGLDKDLVFMGHAVNCANELAKKAGRNNRKKIIFDNYFQNNLSDKEKEYMNKIGGVVKIHQGPFNDYSYSEDKYECDWILTGYNSFINNS